MQILVIARIKAGVEIDRAMPLISSEAAQVWEFYAAEQIRQVYYIADLSGAVMLWEGESVESITQELGKLPMVKENILSCEVLPLKPFTGFASLFAQT
jgi:hypothetical protein